MNKIKREFSYRTTDGTLHSGKNAAKKAKEHQKRIDFRNTMKKILPEIEKILNIEYTNDETVLVDKLNNELSFACDTLDEWLKRIVALYIEVPAIIQVFKFIEDEFKAFK
ncbi:MAG: hypothetical protein E3J47_05925 [Candidatus Stahlbacteria bacterium]|nr:MAG: hypothetical protein E3J47_05925 [Candidatus Stahlbacteria bacterium]